jgi:DNA polymerase I
MNNTLLIDADIIAYQITSSIEEPINWGNDLFTLHSDFNLAKDKYREYIKGLTDTFSPNKIMLFLSDSNNFRKTIYPEYKLNRVDKRKPVCFSEFRKWLFENEEAISEPRLEADDLIGIYATNPEIKGNKIIVSIDKDFKTIPSTISVDGKTVIKVNKTNAQYNHAYQTLTGDNTDNIPGCPGIGPVNAKKILSNAVKGNYWPVVLEAFLKAKLTEKEALIQSRLTYILQHNDYNFKTKKVKLWSPNVR